MVVLDVLPCHESLQHAMQPLSLDALCVLGRKAIRMRTRIVNELSEENRARGRKPTACPPVVKPPRMVLALRAVSLGLSIDRLKRERDLDELALSFDYDTIFGVGRHD